MMLATIYEASSRTAHQFIVKFQIAQNMKLLIVVLCLCAVDVAFGQEKENATATSDECITLNQRRHDLADCCDYPRIHFFRIFAAHCVDECVGTKDICCGMLCVWRNTKVTFHEDGVNLKGLKSTLLESVRHKDEWEDLISKAVDQCDSEGSMKSILSFAVN